MFEVFNVNRNYWILLNIFHRSELVGQPRTHDVGPFKYELGCSGVDCESWEHVGVHVDQFKGWDGFLLNPHEVVVIINDDVLEFLLISGFHLERHDFGFLVPKYCNLVLAEFRLVEDWLSHTFCLRFTDGLLVAWLFGFFQHDF